MMPDDVPLICDPVPGPMPSRPDVFLCDRRLSGAEVKRLRRKWEAIIAEEGAGAFIEPSCRFISVFERHWPDAEFCAA
jgi:hypothetical protein